MITQVGGYTGDAQAANAYISFQNALQACRNGLATERIPVHLGQSFSRSEFLLLPGDIFFIIPEGEEDEEGNWVPPSELWWAAQAVQPHPTHPPMGQLGHLPVASESPVVGCVGNTTPKEQDR